MDTNLILSSGKYFLILAFLISIAETFFNNHADKKRNIRYFISDYFLFGVEHLLLNLITIGSLLNFAHFKNWQLFQWPDSITSFIIALFLYDAFFYLEHYLMHRTRFLWSFHYVHHSSEYFGMSLGFRLSWFRHLRRIFFAFPMFLIGFSENILLGAMMFLNLYALFVHSKLKFKMPIFLNWLMSPYLHSIHHEKQNIKGYNLGGMTTIWDRAFKTYKDTTTDRAEYGIHGYQFTLNPISNQIKTIYEYLYKLLKIS